jgi:hypothetical protein
MAAQNRNPDRKRLRVAVRFTVCLQRTAWIHTMPLMLMLMAIGIVMMMMIVCDLQVFHSDAMLVNH